MDDDPIYRNARRARQLTIDMSQEELRDGFHDMALAGTALAAWLSLAILGLRVQASAGLALTSALLILGGSASLTLRHRRPPLARELLALAFSGGYLGALLTYPHGPLRYFALVVLLICAGMLPTLATFLLTLGLSLALILFQMYLPWTQVGWQEVWAAVVLLWLTAIAAALTSQQQKLALSWASSSTSRAIELTEESRQRQLVLNRTLRAMDEANERLAITNQRLSEARLMANEAWQAKARFAASVSHELRTPLNLIVGFTEVMYSSPQAYEGTVLSPEFLLDLGAVYRNAQHLQKLVDDVLDLAQLNTGKFALQIAPVDLSALVEEAVDTVRNLAAARGLRLLAAIQPNLPTVETDRVRVKQVLLNLLNNALRYTSEGTITVRTGCQDGYILCSVADTGPGISSADQQRLFREFERVDEGGNAAEKGFGLGLAISRRFIEALGGQIHLQSALGRGSTFTITIPRRYDGLIANPTQSTPQVPAHPATRPQDPVILITPSPQAARLFSRHMEGYRCILVRDGLLARQHIADMQPRGIVVDQAIADTVVGELAGALAGDSVQSVPLIVCPMPGEPPAGKRGQVKGYLTKPITREALLDTLQVVGGRAQTILVVDDDEDIVRLFARYLGEDPIHQYRVLEAYNGLEALRLLSQVTPDLILLDVIMPGMDGPTFIERLNANPDWGHIPVIWVTGKDEESGKPAIEGWVRVQMPQGLETGQLIRAVDSLLATLQTGVRLK